MASEIQKISSRENPRLIHARRVRDGKEPDLIFIEGRRLAAEAVRSGVSIRECLIREGFDDPVLSAIAGKCPMFKITERAFSTLADTAHSQGIILVADRPAGGPGDIKERFSSAVPIVLYLHEINNPSNLGAVLRTAEAAGIAGVLVSANSADAFSPKSIRASMGACFRLAVWDRVTFEEAESFASDASMVTTATSASGDLQYTSADWRQPRMLMVGSEAHGLLPSQTEAAQEIITIPMANGVESLNLAVSVGVILFEARRQNSR